MAYENLDAQDKEICEAIERGVSDEEIKSQFGVGDDKIAQLRPVVEEARGGNSDGSENTGQDSQAGDGSASGDQSNQGAGDQA